ncbi:hypothetical protein JCM33774_66060 [Actinophytocola sp. KF-1]
MSPELAALVGLAGRGGCIGGGRRFGWRLFVGAGMVFGWVLAVSGSPGWRRFAEGAVPVGRHPEVTVCFAGRFGRRPLPVSVMTAGFGGLR